MPRLPPQDLDHILGHTHELWEDLRGRNLFLTGGTGFVGKWLLESLLWVNDKLDLHVGVMVLTRNPQRFREQASHLADHPAVRLLEGAADSFEFPSGAFPFVIHAAMAPAFEPTADCPLGAFGSNVDGTRRVLEFACTHGVRRLLFTSSGAIYGKQPPELSHIPEEYAGAPSTMDMQSQYGQAKRASEFMCAMHAHAYGFDAIIARLFAFVGPLLPQDSNFAVGNFIRDALRGGPVRIGGDGTPYRSYLYAADLAIWLWTLLFRGKSAYPYNVGSPHDLTIAALARTVVHVCAPEMAIDIARAPVPGAPSLRYVPCTGRAEAELGLCAGIPLEEGIRRTLEWHQASAALGRS